MVAVTEIAPHPANFRITLTDLDELAESIGPRYWRWRMRTGRTRRP
jgi:hypothetical protein